MPARTRPSAPPRSSGDRTDSYRASTDARRPAGLATRGATAATRSSAKWDSSGSSQPGSGRQSASTNATRGVVTAASPRLRAAAGPPLVVRRSTVTPGMTTGGVDASSTTMTVLDRAEVVHERRARRGP